MMGACVYHAESWAGAGSARAVSSGVDDRSMVTNSNRQGIPGGSALPEWLSGCLGVRPGIRLQPVISPPPGSALCILEASSVGPILAQLLAIEDSSGAETSVDLAVFPLDLRSSPLHEAESSGRWQREWADLHSLARPLEGLVSPSSVGSCAASRAPILPPLFHCREKKVWVAVVCPECGGPSERPPSDSGCPVCGSPERSASEAGTTELWEALRKRVREGGEQIAVARLEGGDAAVIPCVSCERRELCYPADASKRGPGTASDLLEPLSTRPWGGVLLEPCHLPFFAWLRLASGEPWRSVRRRLQAMPATALDAVAARLAGARSFWTGPDRGEVFALESLLLRLDALRQILLGMRGLLAALGHPHLGLRPETLWVRFPPRSILLPALWGAQVQLLETAPGWTRGAYAPRADRPPGLVPPGCSAGDRWLEGVGIPRAVGPSSRSRKSAELNFIPDQAMNEPPGRGETVCLAPSISGPGTDAVPARGRVDVAFSEVCSIVIEDPRQAPAWIQGFFEQQGGVRVRLGIVRDHSLVDDLFAAGTLWLASFLEDPADINQASQFREHLAVAIREGKLVVGARRALASAAPARISKDSAEVAAVAASLPPDLLGAALELGARLCGLFPESYAGQGHEPTLRERQISVYDQFLGDAASLAEQIRDELAGMPRLAGEILSVLEEYASGRTGFPESRTP